MQTAEQVRSLQEGWWGDSGEAVWGQMMKGFVGHTGMGNREPRRAFLRRAWFVS